MMPEMDGFEVAEQIQQDPQLSGAAIMMLSSADHYGEAERCRSLGISIYLRKPIKEADLLDAVQSVLGVGPMKRIEQSAPAVDAPPAGLLRILLVEDTPVNQRLAVTLLEDRGHTVTVANDGLEALDILNRESFDLILMDVQMPRMDGFQATAAIRMKEEEEGTGRHTPILAMTAHAMKGDRERCLAEGMDGYISKPIRAEQFLALVGGLVPITLEPILALKLENVES